MFEVVQLPGRPLNWDRDVRQFATKTLFHESAWLDFAQTIYRRGRIEYFEIRQGASAVGYFCVIRVNKALSFPVYGSPLPEAGSYMGPLVNEGVSQTDVMQALVRLCKRKMILSDGGKRLARSAVHEPNGLCGVPERDQRLHAAHDGSGRMGLPEEHVPNPNP